jgi:DNA-binding beta-propeller fold protein YncE
MQRRRSVGPLCLALAVTAALVLPAAAAASTSVYVTDTGRSAIHQFHVHATTGRLAPMSPATVDTSPQPFSLAVTPDAGGLFNAGAQGFASQFTILPSGALRPNSPRDVSLGAGLPTGVAVSPNGTSGYFANQSTPGGGGGVLQFDINAAGRLVPKSPAQAGFGLAQGVALTPDGTSAYVGDNDGSDGLILQYNVAANGTLRPKQPPSLPSTGDALGIAISPDGRNAYFADTIDRVNQFTIASGGKLVPKSPAFVRSDAPFGIAITPNGRYAYVVNRGAGQVAQFDLNAAGKLVPKSPAHVKAGSSPISIAISPDGGSAYVTDQGGAGNGQVLSFDIRSDGRLAPKTPFATKSGAQPGGVVVTPAGTPTPAFSVDAAPAGRAAAFDGSASTAPGGSITRYRWNFGDGTVRDSSGPRPSHVYRRPGHYTARLTVFNNCDPDAVFKSGVVFTGQSAYCTGPPKASATRTVTIGGASGIR